MALTHSTHTVPPTGLYVLYNFIEAPRDAASATRRRPLVGLGVLGYAVASLSIFLASRLVEGSGMSEGALFLLGFMFIWRLGTGIVLTAVVHFIAESMDGEGKGVPLFVLMGLSELTWTLLLPGTMLILAFLPGSRWAGTALFGIVGLVCLGAKARSVAHNYGFGALKAWFSLLVPYLAVAAVGTLLFFTALVGFMHQLIKLFS